MPGHARHHWKDVERCQVALGKCLNMKKKHLPSINGTLRKHQTTPWDAKGCQVEPGQIQGVFGNVTKTLEDVGKTLKVDRGIKTM